jgi:hypothetical protein
MPYFLASMHTIMHLSLLTASLVLQIVDYDLFFNVPNSEMCLEGDKAKYFISTDKFWLTSYICMAHVIAIVC